MSPVRPASTVPPPPRATPPVEARATSEDRTRLLSGSGLDRADQARIDGELRALVGPLPGS